MSYTAVVITVSDSCARGEREDRSGAAVFERLASAGFEVTERIILPDEPQQIRSTLLDCVHQEIRFIVTTGGTGISARDVTPEATMSVCERLLPGIPELMREQGRKQTLMSALSRAVCGTRAQSLILNLPGSPAGAVASLESVLPLIPHSLELLAGNTRHND